MDTVKHKYIFYFYKKGWLIFISHLNLMRLFERAFKKAALPVTYSQGFNPHMRLSLPFPLTLGYVGLNELGEIYLDSKVAPQEFLEKLNKNLPSDVQLTAAEHKNVKSLNQLARSYDYTVVFKPGFIPDTLPDLLQNKKITVEKINKKGKVNQFLLSDYLQDYSVAKNKFSFTLLVRDQKTVDVDQLLKVLGIKIGEIEDILRERINCATF